MAVPVPWYRVDTTEQIVYLTFDDGPYVQADVPVRVTATTEELRQKLSALRAQVNDNELSATFFLNGWALTRQTPDDPYNPDAPNAIARRDAARLLIEDGHNVANHAYWHDNPAGEPWKTHSNRERATVDQMLENVTSGRRDLYLIGTRSHKDAILNYWRSPGDPSYWVPSPPRDKRNQRKPMERVYQNNNPEALNARRRLERVIETASACNTQYVTFNIFTKDDRLHNDTNFPIPLEEMAKWVYWHFINVTELNKPEVRAQFVSKLKGFLPDPDRLSFETLPVAERSGAIALMHNGRAASVMALGTFAGLPGIIPYLYGKGFRVRKLPGT